MNEQDNWDDLRLVLAVARAGSLSGAARALAVSHATVFRHLNAVEARLGLRLFERLREGYAPTPAGEELAATGARVEAQINDARRRLAGRDRRIAGTVRLTTTDTLFDGLCAPLLAGLRAAHPELALEIELSNRLRDLSRRDADIALRPGDAPPPHLVGRKLAPIAQAVYRGTAAHADTTAWVAPDVHMGDPRLARWYATQTNDDAHACTVDTMGGMAAAIGAGLGRGVLPCYLGDARPDLERVGAPIAALDTDLWLLTHPDLRRVVRVRTVMRYVADALNARRAALRDG